MGQDVGELGEGASGFSGDDGRSTIFDYWGVPEHIKWVNNGAFDGALLSEDQKKLREAYRSILTSTNLLDALSSGGFYDLHYYNRSPDVQGYSDQIYAFLRHTEAEQLLVIINFNTKI